MVLFGVDVGDGAVRVWYMCGASSQTIWRDTSIICKSVGREKETTALSHASTQSYIIRATCLCAFALLCWCRMWYDDLRMNNTHTNIIKILLHSASMLRLDKNTPARVGRKIWEKSSLTKHVPDKNEICVFVFLVWWYVDVLRMCFFLFFFHFIVTKGRH